MKGHNRVWLSGNVGGKIVDGVTGDKNPACSFSIASEAPGRGTTWARINVYGPLALQCKTRLRRGCYISVEGELMNRDGHFGELTEVRAKEIIFYPSFAVEQESTEQANTDNRKETSRER